MTLKLLEVLNSQLEGSLARAAKPRRDAILEVLKVKSQIGQNGVLGRRNLLTL